jgi:hypothetical protein
MKDEYRVFGPRFSSFFLKRNHYYYYYDVGMWETPEVLCWAGVFHISTSKKDGCYTFSKNRAAKWQKFLTTSLCLTMKKPLNYPFNP